MNFEMHRDQDGKVAITDGDASVEVQIEDPQTSALGVLANNYVVPGDVFGKDHYVYRDGKRVRKWFSTRSGIKVLWEPNLERIAWLEALRWKVLQQHQDLWAEIFEVVHQIRDAGGRAHAQPLHAFEGSSDDEYWLYKVSWVDQFQSWSYSFDWVDKPKRRRRLKLGQKLYSLEYTRSKTVRRRLHVVTQALTLALERKICGKNFDQLKKYKAGQVIRFEINGRLYWYEINYNRSGVLWPKVLCWPETEILDIDVA